MRILIRFVPFLLLLSAVFSCSSTPGKHNDKKDTAQVLAAGKLTERNHCISDASVSYALYIPSTFSAGQKLPVFLAFDPHGNGLLPVNKFKSLAEKYRFILMGSNDSKNNQTMEETARISEALLDEITNHIPVDAGKIYLTGFSGGSRVASILVRYKPGIRGMIGCGAGLAAINQPSQNSFDYFGLVGNADFNMQEMILLDQDLATAGLKHSLVIFKGKHDWPAPEYMELGFRWMLGDTLNSSYQEAVAGMIKAGNVFPKVKFGKEIRDKELKKQQDYLNSFFKKDISWWKKQVSGLRKTSGLTEDEIAMNQRILSYLSLVCYSQSSRALAEKDKTAAGYSIQLYGLVDPDNPAVKEMQQQLEQLP
ncbi:MAG: hypothetical protein Q8867_02105 [Bacteroidota bacterium]|nr:hypothetical protein [Bacteroidota bacterium]